MKYAIIVVGTSLGGLHALKVVLGGLPPAFALPVVVVQHRRYDADETLAQLLQRQSAVPVSEAEDKQPIEPGHVYLAPASYHVLVERTEVGPCLALSTEGPVSYARPSIDVLFESAADAYGERAIGVILTGTNQDGAAGLAAITTCGGLGIVQDPATAEAPAMPVAAIAATPIKHILPLPAIAPFLSRQSCPNEERS